jgi:hypothetical protein
MRLRYLFGCIVLTVAASIAVVADESADLSLSSWPPDLNSYFRDAVPADNLVPSSKTRAAVNLANFAPPTVVDVVVNNTNATLKTTDAFNDGEPTIAINPLNPNQISLTAFSGGWGANSVLWNSTDGGTTWAKESTIPAPPGIAATGCPCDQAIDYGRGNRLSGTFLTATGGTNVYSGTTTNPANAASWNWFGNPVQRTNFTGVNNSDQPWLLVNRDPTIAAQDNVYVAYDNFSGAPDMRVSVARGTNPPNFVTDALVGISTPFVNPGHRMAVNKGNGTVYSLFQRRIAAGAGASQNIDYMLNRSTDGGTTWSLNGNPTGIIVANGDSTQPQAKFGTVNALLGGVLHATVDPSNGDVYYVYGRRDAGTGNNRLAIRRITDAGPNMLVGGESFVTGQVQAALPSVAVTDNGFLAVFYYTSNGVVSGFPQFTAHLALSDDQGATFVDQVLETFLSSAIDNGDPRQRVFGDYVQLKVVGRVLFGVYTGNGVPFGRTTSNHDPIFYKQDLNRQPTANAGTDVTVSADATCKATVTLHGSGTDPDGDTLTYTWTGVFGTVVGKDPTVILPLGTHSILLTVTDGKGGSATDTVSVTVNDTTAPIVSAVTPSRTELFPPNHKMINITLNYTATDNCSSVTCTVAVTANEPINGLGDGNTEPDWVVVDAKHIQLRAERSGLGTDRIYTITVTCKDPAGNTTVRTTYVTVPHDQGN